MKYNALTMFGSPIKVSGCKESPCFVLAEASSDLKSGTAIMKQGLASKSPRDTSFDGVITDPGAVGRAVACGQSLPPGVKLRSLQPQSDERGALTELFRASWDTGVDVVQWNYVQTNAEVLRGVHLHLKHFDYLILLKGHATIGLKDLRPDSTSEGLSALVEMHGNDPHALSIPPGVAHGFYFHEPSIHIYGVSEFWDPKDELGCHWSDAALELSWPNTAPVISARDAALPSLDQLVQSVRRGQQS